MSAMVRREAVSILREYIGGKGSTYALLHEDTELALIFDIDELLAAIGRVGDVQLLGRIKLAI